MLVIEHLIKAIRRAAEYNLAAQVAPCCILWPDKERQWEKVIPRLQVEMHELFVLGEYSPQERRGPAIWLRCAVAGKVEGVFFDRTPILYLPGVSRQDLRAVDQCDEALKPLVELQYRGVIWSQVNARDWSVFAYFKTIQGGLGLEVAQDNASVDGLRTALSRLLDEEIETLKSRYLDQEFYNILLAGNDPVKDLLLWLVNPDAFTAARTEEKWQAFVAVCKAKFGFDPMNDGNLTAAEKIAMHEGAWGVVWDRFCEAPERYKVVPELIFKTVMPIGVDSSGWPQANENEEAVLRTELLKTQTMIPVQARDYVLRLEAEHGERRESVWASMGWAPLANSLKWLTIVADVTAQPIAGSIDDIVSGYTQRGWQADDAVLKALMCVEKPDDIEALTTAIRVIYKQWLEDTALQFQSCVKASGYPGGSCESMEPVHYRQEECILFIDGLRFDLAKQLAERLNLQGLKTEEKIYWASLPTVTATCKPAVMPIRSKLHGAVGNIQFEPSIKELEQLATGPRMNKLLEAAGWTVLEDDKTVTPNAWDEAVSIDAEGHQRGWKIAQQIDLLLRDITAHIALLLAKGWKQIRIVSDHGWLLLPGGLPKIELPSSLSDNKWGRCAMLKAGAVCEESMYPWYWNPHVQVAMTDGISCYRNGMEYSHGGVSLQECLLLRLQVTGDSSSDVAVAATIADVVWHGFKCKVAVEGDWKGTVADLRLQAGNKDTSIALAPKPMSESGIATLFVEDDSLEEKAVTLVLVDGAGQIIAQQATVVGGEQN